jgi:arylsulfatase
MAMVGASDVIDQLKKGYKAIGRTYKNHIDGFNLVPYLTGEVKQSPRNFFFYFSDDGDLLALRFDNWKAVFMEQRCRGTMQVWAEPFTRLRLPKLFNLRTDPYEFADVTSNSYWDWLINNGILALISSTIVGRFLETFREFPPVQKPNTFTIDQAMEKMNEAASGAMH